jgi:hypothetical protein
MGLGIKKGVLVKGQTLVIRLCPKRKVKKAF